MPVTAKPAPDGTRWPALLSLLIAVFLGSLDQSIANTALPAIGAALQRTPAESVWIVHAYQLAVVAGPLSDRYPSAILGGLGLGMLSIGMLGLGAVLSLARLRFR